MAEVDLKWAASLFGFFFVLKGTASNGVGGACVDYFIFFGGEGKKNLCIELDCL